jgi:uncharacterized peroxidase-related enzyme
MTFLHTTPAADASGAVAAMYARQQAAWGYLPNYAKVFCHRPEVMARWGQLLAEIRRPMDRRRFELVTFVAAHELRNSPCALAHGRALREFLSDAQVLALAAGRDHEALVPAEQAMVRFARQVARDAACVTAADVSALRDLGYTDAEVFDIVATAAGRAFFTKVLDALGVQPDAAFGALEAPLRDALTVGRPIDAAAGS